MSIKTSDGTLIVYPYEQSEYIRKVKLEIFTLMYVEISAKFKHTVRERVYVKKLYQLYYI